MKDDILCYAMVIIMKNINEKEYDITPSAMIVVGSRIYFAEASCAGLFYYDIEEQNVEYIGCLCNDLNGQSSFLSVVQWNDNLIFIPYVSNNISIYNLTNETIEQIELPNEIKSVYCKFFHGCILKDFLYIFGHDIQCIYVFDLKKKVFHNWADITTNLRSCFRSTIQNGLFVRDSVVKGQIIYLISLFENAVFALDIKKNAISRIEMDSGDYGFSGMCVLGEKCYLIPNVGSDLTIFDMETQYVEKVSNNFEDCMWSYVGGVLSEKQLFMIPCVGKTIIRYDIENKEFFAKENISEEIKFGEYYWEIVSPVIYNKKIMASFIIAHGIMVLDIDSNNLEHRNLKSKKMPSIDLSKAICESIQYSLFDFVNAILR